MWAIHNNSISNNNQIKIKKSSIQPVLRSKKIQKINQQLIQYQLSSKNLEKPKSLVTSDLKQNITKNGRPINSYLKRGQFFRIELLDSVVSIFVGKSGANLNSNQTAPDFVPILGIINSVLQPI